MPFVLLLGFDRGTYRRIEKTQHEHLLGLRYARAQTQSLSALHPNPTADGTKDVEEGCNFHVKLRLPTKRYVPALLEHAARHSHEAGNCQSACADLHAHGPTQKTQNPKPSPKP